MTLCSVALLGATSCNGFLSEESQDEVIVRTVADYSELLFGSGYPSPSEGEYNIMYAMDDDYQIREPYLNTDETTLSALAAYPFFTWQPSMWRYTVVDYTLYDYKDPYSATYERIMGVNAVLDGIDDAINGTAEDKAIVKAEALGLRGYYYYMLTNLFGKPYNVDPSSLGVPLKLTASIEANGIKRSTVMECYRQIVSDMTQADSIFRMYDKRRGSYRMNLPTVDILLSRVYLQQEQWQKVVDVCSEAIKTGGALTDYSTLAATAGGTQSIASYNNSEVEWVFGCGVRACNLGSLMASAELTSLFTNDDYRTGLWFSNGNVFKNRHYLTTTNPTKTIRTSEAYLARAEAFARLGNLDEALADLNALRQCRYKATMPGRTMAMPATKEALLDSILEERRRELCFDEVRWFDLRRLGMPQLTHRYKAMRNASWSTYVLQENDPLYTLPIPATALVANPDLKQNSSADEPERKGN